MFHFLGTSSPAPCPVGFYCLQGNGTTECPRLTYRDTTGAATLTDCQNCPAGYFCNDTGISDYTGYECPVGFFCPAGGEPELCPAGTLRNTTGAASAADCPDCRPGYYCPNDTINTEGIPCRPTYECPSGASIEVDCRPGHYCVGVTGFPPLCPPGYYCPGATETPINCTLPYYCPQGSNMTMKCDLGYRAMDHAGIRYDPAQSCNICPPGTYGNYTDRSICETCPAGYYCPEGTAHGDTNPCPIGYYCPIGSDSPTACPAGMRGYKLRSEGFGECQACPANTFNDLPGQTYCRPCGSSSYSTGGAAICTCEGNYRAFQKSVGTCVCLAGYIYYDEVDSQQTESNSDQDCQQIVDTRCSVYEVRMAADRTCRLPENVDCNAACVDSGGYLDTNLGM